MTTYYDEYSDVYGDPVVYGVGTGSFGFTGTAAGAPSGVGSAAGSFGFTGTAAGVPTVVGAAVASLTFTGAIGGLPSTTASGSFVFTGSASGGRTVVGAPAGDFGFAAFAAGGLPSVVVASRGVGCRLRAYLPNGADQGPLPGPESQSASFVLNDVGALTFSYAPRAPRSSLLGQPLEVALEVSTDGGSAWFEPPNSRFIYVSDGRNPLDPGDSYSVECKSYVWRLGKAVVLPNGLLNAEGKRAFLSGNVGVILKTLLNEAQARGALSGLVHSSFSTTTDSAGAAWSKTITIYYEPGVDYLTILQNLADQGFCDFRTNGRALQVYNPDTALAVDRTVGAPQVTLRAGRDLTEAPFRRTWESLANFGFFAGGEGATYEFTNPAGAAPWGRQEIFISNGSVTDAGTMAALTQTQLDLSNGARVEHTRGLDFARATNLPFTNYGPGDYIWSAVDGLAPERLRIRQLTLSADNKRHVGGSVVLNDRFLEADVRLQRRIQGITNGASSGTGTGGPPPSTDSKPPAQVTGLTGSSAAYTDPGSGKTLAQVTLTWGAVVTNFDGTAADDINHYEVYRRLVGSPVDSEVYIQSTPQTTWTHSPYTPGQSYWFRVSATDRTGNKGARSTEFLVTMASDSTPPQQPAPPVATNKLGVLSIAWDGQPATGTWPLDFDRVEVHVSAVNEFTPSSATLWDHLYGKGVSIYPNGTYGTPYFVKLVPVDKSGNVGTASAQATGTPLQLLGSDVQPSTIGYDQIAYKDPGNLVPDGSFEDSAYVAALLARSDSAWQMTTTNPFHGLRAAAINAATNASTNRHLNLTGPTTADSAQILPGDKLFCRFAYNGSSGANGDLRIIVTWMRADGTFNANSISATVKDGTWQTASGQLTAPALTVAYRVRIELTNTGTSGTYLVDAVEVRRTIGTLLVEDAAINNAKISDLDVGKLTAGIMTANVTVSGKFATALTGDRVEFNNTGLKMIQGGVTKVNIAPTGNAQFTGEITGSTMTGGIVRTAAINSRIEIDHAGGLKAYRDDGTTNFEIIRPASPGADGAILGEDASLVFRAGAGQSPGFIRRDSATLENKLLLRSTTSAVTGAAMDLYANGAQGVDGDGHAYSGSTRFYAENGAGTALKILNNSVAVFRAGYLASDMKIYHHRAGTATTSDGGSSAWKAINSGAFIVFRGPPSGAVRIDISMYLRTSNISSEAHGGFEVRVGDTVGAGSVVVAPQTLLVNGNLQFARFGGFSHLINLTRGTLYNIRAYFRSSNGSFTVNASDVSISITPSAG